MPLISKTIDDILARGSSFLTVIVIIKKFETRKNIYGLLDRNIASINRQYKDIRYPEILFFIINAQKIILLIIRYMTFLI